MIILTRSPCAWLPKAAARRRRPASSLESAWQVAVYVGFKWRYTCYGTCRLRAELYAQGYCVGRWRVRQAVAVAGQRAQQPRPFAFRAIDLGSVCAFHNRFVHQPVPSVPNQVWVGDITYLPSQSDGGRYLVTRLDRYSCKIVVWDERESRPKNLVREVLCRTPVVRQPAGELAAYSDQGRKYSATDFKALVACHKTMQNMSQRGNCYNNAHAESFWN